MGRRKSVRIFDTGKRGASVITTLNRPSGTRTADGGCPHMSLGQGARTEHEVRGLKSEVLSLARS